MKSDISYLLYALTSLFTIVNPLGAIPFYSVLTESSDDAFSRKVALRACVAAFVAMLFFALTGKFIFSFFNVSIDGLRLVGGVVFFITGYDMLQGLESRTKSLSDSEKINLQDVNVKAITPLAIPLICGPGTITIMTVMTHESHTLTHRIIIFSSAFIVSVATFFILASSKKIMAAIGESGSKVFFRLMGLILMMIAVEFFFTGLKPYIHGLL